MRESPYPLEQSLGISWYATETEGIGGHLREEAGDFVVEEVPAGPWKDTGQYLILRLTKRNWEQQRLVKEMARALGISHRRISWAGTKDRKAVTSQYISIHGLEPDAVERITLPDIRLEAAGRSDHPIALGELKGNRFTIRIRDCDPSGLAERVDEVARASRVRIPELRRDTAVRGPAPRNPSRGREDSQGRSRGSRPHLPGSHLPVRTCRDAGGTGRFPGGPGCEGGHPAVSRTSHFRAGDAPSPRREPGRLSRGPEGPPPPPPLDVRLGIPVLPLQYPPLPEVRGGDPPGRTRPGRPAPFPDGKEDRVTRENLDAAVLQVARKRARIGLFVPGSGPVPGQGQDGDPARALLREIGITPENFTFASKLVSAAYAGMTRPVALTTEIERHVEGNDVLLGFFLGPGQYATTVCREFMKADPVRMI